MNYHRLKVFYLVARLGSFSRAAEELYTSQPNISKHVQQLEAELGSLLLHRLGSGVEQTEAGRLVYRYAEQVFDLTADLERSLAELAGLERGFLRLGASSTPGLYLLPPVIAAFGRDYPGLEVSFSISNSSQVVHEVLAGKLDLGFVGGFIEAAGLQKQLFGRDEVVLIASPEHRLTQQENILAAELARERFVVREPGSGTYQVTEAALAELDLRPERLLEMPGCEAVKRTVAAGLGLSFVSRRAVDLELKQGILAVLPGLRFSRELYAISRKDVRLSPAALAFLAFARRRIMTQPAGA
jgi:DNA-binding transcriptional LysR family regulator